MADHKLATHWVRLIHVPICVTQPDWMSRASVSRIGILGNPNLVRSNPDPACSNPGGVKSMTLKLILVAPWPSTQHYLDRAMTGWLSVRIMWLSGIAGHGANVLDSWWGSTIKSPWVRAITSRHPSWYAFRCCQVLRFQHPTNPSGYTTLRWADWLSVSWADMALSAICVGEWLVYLLVCWGQAENEASHVPSCIARLAPPTVMLHQRNPHSAPLKGSSEEGGGVTDSVPAFTAGTGHS